MNVMSSPKTMVVKKDIINLSRIYRKTFKGQGSISGVIKESGVPVGGYIIQLYHNPSNYFISQTISDTSGAYQFTNIDENQLFDIIAFDPNNMWEKRVSSRRIPRQDLHDVDVLNSSGESIFMDIDHPQKRYWRIRFTAAASGTQIGLRQIEMSSESGGPDVCNFGTPFSSGIYNTDFYPENAFDGGFTGELPAWAPPNNSFPNWIGYDCVTTQNINFVRITSRQTSFATQSPRDFIVQSSYDNTTWTDEWAVTGQTGWTANQTREFSRPGMIDYMEPLFFDGASMDNIVSTDSALHWRVLITESNGVDYHMITELELLSGGVNKCTGGTPFASSVLGGYAASNAFDGQKTTAGNFWCSTNGTIPAWLGYTFAEPVDIQEVRLTARANDGGSLDRTPKSFTVQKSEDGTTWYDVWTVSGQTGWTYSEERSFPRT